MYQRGIPLVLKVFLQEISENYLRVTPIRSVDYVIIISGLLFCGTESRQAGWNRVDTSHALRICSVWDFLIGKGDGLMEELRTEGAAKYGQFLLPALCLAVGILIGFLLSPVKSGRVTLLSGNTIGSNNGSKNSAADILVGGQKSR